MNCGRFLQTEMSLAFLQSVAIMQHSENTVNHMETTMAEDSVEIRRDEKGRPIADDGYPIGGLATVDDAVTISGLGRSHIYSLMARGQLEVRRFGRSRRITWASLRAAFLE